MLETPQLTQTAIQLTACVHLTVPRAQIREVMGPGLDEVKAALAAQRIAATRVARAVYRGPYEGLASAWGEFIAWIAANGHRPAPDFWERYVVGPESGLAATEWRTELNRPLVD